MLPAPVDRLVDIARRLQGAVRSVTVRWDVLNRRLPWSWWCALAAVDSLAVTWVIARRAGRPLTFVQIGANDGMMYDPLHTVVRAAGWSGVLVEPVPALYERLVANYSGVPNVQFENAAIGATDGTATLYSVEPRPDDPYWVGLLPSLDRDIIRSHHHLIPGIEERIQEMQVASLTLPSLVARHDLAVIDLLNVDTEGYDYEILRQIDFSSGWAPAFIIYERRHLDRSTDRQARRMLRGAGYRLSGLGPDLLAYRSAPEELGGSQGGRGRRRTRRS